MSKDTIYREDATKAFVEETNGVNVEEAIKVVDAYLRIRECDEVWDSIRAIRDCLECAKDEIAEFIPSADRPQEWIPCSERLPEEEGNYLVTFGAFAETINGEKVIFGDIDGSVSEIGYGCYERDIFWQPTAFGWYDLDTATPFDKRAIKAWMPLPKPWKGADDEFHR